MKEDKLIPKRRFKEFKDDGNWEERKLFEVAEFNPKSELPNIFEYVDLESVVGTEMISHRTETKSSAPSRAQRLARNGDVFYQTVRPYQKNNYLFIKSDNNYVFSTGYAQMRPNIDNTFLMSFLQTEVFVKVVLDNCTGTSYPAINSTDLSNLEISLPISRDEQEKIGTFFSNLDNLIILHQRKLKKLKETKSAYLSEMFPKEGEKYPKRRFAGFTGRWEERKLFEYAEFLRGNGLRKDDIAKDGQQECILYGNLYTEYGMITDVVVNKTNTQLKNPIYSKFGDVLIPASDTTPTGLARATSIEKSEVLLGGDINIVRPNIDVNGSCLSLAINANRKELIKLIKGTTVKHIHNSDIQYINISLPKSQDEQIKIVDFFKQLDNLITLHQQKLEKLENLKKAYLNEMFV